MAEIRAWRAAERKKMVESMDIRLSQAQRMATSRYTRSAQRPRWTRLAGQLLWYKDQILRGMTYEALEKDMKEATSYIYEKERKQSVPQYSIIRPAPYQPTIVKKREEEQENKDPVYTGEASKEPVA